MGGGYRGEEAPAVAGARSSPTAFPNNRKPPILNGYRYWCVDGKSGLFQPGTFEKKERGDRVAAIGFALQGVVPAAFADFEGAVFHGRAPLIGSFNECP